MGTVNLFSSAIREKTSSVRQFLANKMRATAVAKMAQMRYPYTLGAQLMQVPYKFHYNNCWYTKAICWYGIPGASAVAAYFQYKTNGDKFHLYQNNTQKPITT